MHTFDANVIASPSETTEVGRRILAENPKTTGSLGCAISEAVEKAVTTKGCRYVLEMCIRDRFKRLNLFVPLRIGLSTQRRFSGSRLRHGHIPVSYTHLDVYKRQHYQSGSG